MDRRLLVAVVIVTLLSSNPVISQRRTGGERGPHQGGHSPGHPPRQPGQGSPPGESMCQTPGQVPGTPPGGPNQIPSRVIGLVLNERCQEWRRLRRPLPPFCLNAVAPGIAAKVPDTILCENYKDYWKSVSDEDRRRDHDAVRRKHGSWD